MERLKALWLRERPAVPLWTPVFFGIGVQLYFWAPVEPRGWALTLAAAAPVLIWTIFWRRLRRFSLLGFALALIALGFALSGGRARLVEAPVLAEQIDATVEGVVLEMQRTRTGRPRVVLDDLVIFGLNDDATPEKVQIALLRDSDAEGLRPGQRLSVFAHLGPPGGPVEPGGFDYRRTAWFLGIGGVGYARGAPVEIRNDATPSLMRRAFLHLAGWRAEISRSLRAQMQGETGAFAAAVTVGDRAGVSEDSLEALRKSNLAHLLAISGLHMGLVTALVFGAARLLLALTPVVSRRWRTKRIAAMIALAAAVAYLALSGASVATQRAFIMAAVALGAIMMNRPAITMRALAVAALIILVVRPESLTHVGFQMSFAATAAIIAGFDFARERGWSARFTEGGPLARVGGYILALAATSALAGAATAPFAAFHFNQMSHYGLLGNLVAVPVMGFWVAPSALVAVVLAPFGAEGAALAVMGLGIDAIIDVARFVSGLEGASRAVQAAPSVVLTFVALGGLCLCLGRYLLRWAGVGLVAASLAIWLIADARPQVLVAPEAKLIGVMGDGGRALDHGSSSSYAAGIWLRRDGDEADQKAAAARAVFAEGYAGPVVALANGWRVANVLARRPAPAELDQLCEAKVAIFAPYAIARPGGDCLFFGRDDLRETGALSIRVKGDKLIFRTAAEAAGRRYWTRAAALSGDQSVGAR